MHAHPLSAAAPRAAAHKEDEGWDAVGLVGGVSGQVRSAVALCTAPQGRGPAPLEGAQAAQATRPEAPGLGATGAHLQHRGNARVRRRDGWRLCRRYVPPPPLLQGDMRRCQLTEALVDDQEGRDQGRNDEQCARPAHPLPAVSSCRLSCRQRGW